MSRISREQMYMDIAHTVAKRSTCHRLNVGAVLVVENNIASIGYNGSMPDHPHCGGTTCPYFNPGITQADADKGKTIGCQVVHAEANALARAPRDVKGGVLYVTHSPCAACASIIIVGGIEAVHFEQEYRDRAGISFLLDAPGLVIKRIQPSGHVMDMRTGAVTVLQ